MLMVKDRVIKNLDIQIIQCINNKSTDNFKMNFYKNFIKKWSVKVGKEITR